MSIKTTKRMALAVIASLVFAPFAAIAPATAASGDLDGKVICTTSTTAVNAATVAAGTATTALAPHTFTTVAGAAFKCTVSQETDYEAVEGAAFSLADFTSASTVWTTETVAGGDATTTDPTTAAAVYGATAPATAGTYYLKISETGGTAAYVKLVVANALAYLGDGLDALGGTATAASSGSTTVNGVAGPANSVTVHVLKNASAGKRGLVTVSGADATISTGGTVAANYLSTTIPADGLTTQAIVIKTPTAGTITVSYYPETTAGGGIFSTTASTVTVTVNAATVTGGIDVATSTSVIKTGATWAAGASATTDDTVVVSRTASTTPGAVVKVALGQVSGAITTTTAVTASVSGPGVLVLNDNNDHTTSPISTGRSLSSTVASTTETFYVLVQPDGVSGVATVTITAGSFTATETVTFHGAVASYVLTTKNAVLAVGSTSDAQVLTVAALDSAGVAIPSSTVYVSSSATTIATVDAATVTTSAAGVAADIGVNGVAKGSAVITVGNAATSPTVSATATITIAAAGISSVALSFDKATYLPGEKATVTVTMKNADAALVGDQANADVFATGGITPSANLTTAMTATALTSVNGVTTYTVYMPLAEGPVSLSATLGTGVATAAQGTTVTASATVAKPVVVVPEPEPVFEKPTLAIEKSGGRIYLSGTAADGEGDIIIYVKRIGTSSWKERAKTLEVAAPGDFNGSIRAPKNNVVIRVKQEGTGLFSNQVIALR